jgi:hypothetical protein
VVETGCGHDFLGAHGSARPKRKEPGKLPS